MKGELDREKVCMCVCLKGEMDREEGCFCLFEGRDG